MHERARPARSFAAILAVARMELLASLRDRQTALLGHEDAGARNVEPESHAVVVELRIPPD